MVTQEEAKKALDDLLYSVQMDAYFKGYNTGYNAGYDWGVKNERRRRSKTQHID